MDELRGGSDGHSAAAESSNTTWDAWPQTGELPFVELGIPGIRDAREIGWGGSAVVYRAVDHLHRSDVAVKLLDARNVGEAAETGFRREAAALGALTWHPHIVRVHSTGVTGRGRPYLVMEYAAKGSLAERLERSGALAWQVAIHIGVQVAGALEAAHRAGVLHRDVKPDNILVSASGEPKLADFGIARLEGVEEAATTHVTATPVHAAPEILCGSEASAMTDVYSLGSTLFTLLTGRPPFQPGPGEQVSALAKRITEAPVPDLRWWSVPAGVRRIVERALSKEAAKRPATAEAFGRELQAAQADAGLAVTPLIVREQETAPRLRLGLIRTGRAVTVGRARTWQRASALIAAALVVGTASLMVGGRSSVDHSAPPAATPTPHHGGHSLAPAHRLVAGPDAEDATASARADTSG